MRLSSIRLRLTAWYSFITFGTLCLMSSLMWVALSIGIDEAVKEELSVRADVVQSFIRRELPGKSIAEQREILGNAARVETGRRLLRITDSQGRLLYQNKQFPELHEIAPPTLPAPERSSPESFSTVKTKEHSFLLMTFQSNRPEQGWVVQLACRLDEFQEGLHRFGWILLALLPLGLLLTAGGGYFMSRRALAPVDHIIRAAQAIGPSNLAKGLLVPQTGDELQRLTETLNEMMRRLDTAFRSITRFTADASHELRTPMAIMHTAAELALRNPRTPAQYREALRQILIEVVRTTELIDKLMLLARSDAGVQALQVERMNLADSLSAAYEQCRVLAEARGVEMQIELPRAPVLVDGDEQALRRLFLIFFDNAVKYTPSGGRVFVSLACHRGLAVCRIRDTGVGIAPEDLPKIFERFYRADKARSRSEGSVGLGLSIARWLIDAHQGSVDVQSTVGEGSEFQIRIPLRNPQTETPFEPARSSDAEAVTSSNRSVLPRQED
ncbi:MAG: ATP-binding protein [Acidobacteriota bacterium]